MDHNIKLTGDIREPTERRAFCLKMAVETERRFPLPEALDVAGVVIRTARAYEAYVDGSNPDYALPLVQR